MLVLVLQSTCWLSWIGDPFLVICVSLHCLQDQNNQTFLKISATHFSITSLICGKTCKNASLSQGTKLSELKALRNEALKDLDQDKDDWEEGEQQEGEPAGKKRRMADTTVDIEVHGVKVTLLCPPKRAMVADLMVSVQPEMLAAVFKYIQPDCKEQNTPRSYTKTGQFSKGASD